MNEIIGVLGGSMSYRLRPPKREALLFDRIAIHHLHAYIREEYEGPDRRPLLASEFEWLSEQGIIFDATIARDPELEADEKYWQTFLSMLDKGKHRDSLLK